MTLLYTLHTILNILAAFIVIIELDMLNRKHKQWDRYIKSLSPISILFITLFASVGSISGLVIYIILANIYKIEDQLLSCDELIRRFNNRYL